MTAIQYIRLARAGLAAARAWIGIGALLGLAACGGGGSGDSGGGAVPPGSAGTFTSVAAMSNARSSPSSAVLPDGRVLVAGGFQNGRPLASTEIFNPATGQWSSGPAMAVTRADGFLVRLNDGRVLALGSANSQVFDPGTNLWSAIPTPTGGVAGPFVVLASGRVVALTLGAQANVYNPATNTWQSFTGFDGRRDFAAAPLPDGRVLISGGRLGSGTTPTATTLIFNPDTGQWQAGPNMNLARREHFAFVLNDGRIVVSHGTTQGGSVNGTTEVYSPATNSWSVAGNVIKFDASTTGATCTQLSDGSYLVAGGRSAAGNIIQDQQSLNETNAEIFDPQTLQWRRATAVGTGLAQPRYRHAAARLPNGQVLLMGGLSSSVSVSGVDLSSVERYNP